MPRPWPDFSRRNTGSEYIDNPRNLTDVELARTFHELTLVNRWLGGRRSIVQPFTFYLKEYAGKWDSKPVTILDVGCGSGDIMAALKRWGKINGIGLHIVGIDLSYYALKNGEINADADQLFVQADVHHLPISENGVDFVICSAFLHHFDDQAATLLLSRLSHIARAGILISDLRRHMLAYLGIRILTSLFSSSRAVRHDGPLSVLKAFGSKELRQLVIRAGLNPLYFRKFWAFRHSVIAVPVEESR